MTYRAFLSYSHAADGKLAPAIQSALQSFAKRWYERRAIRVFRDKTTLGMTPKLWPSIQVALDESEYFLLLASVESGQSEWVQREVEHWLQNKPLDKLLIIVTGSRPLAREDTPVDFDWVKENVLPANLVAKLPKEEPLYLDLRWIQSEEQLSARNPRFLDEVAGLVATLTGREKDELVGEDLKQHRRLRRLTVSAIILLVMLTVASALAAVWATWQRDKAVARQWVATSIPSEAADPELSVLMAAQGVAATWWWGHMVLPEAEQQLHRSILASHVRLTVIGHTKRVSTVAWSPDGERLETGSWDGSVMIWHPITGKQLFTLGAPNSEGIFDPAWSPDGQRVAAQTSDTVKVLGADGKELLSFHPTTEMLGFETVAWSPSGKQLATGNTDGTVTVWDAETGRSVFSLAGHTSSVFSVAWSPTGGRLAAGSTDQTVKVWDVSTQKELFTVRDSRGAAFFAWSPGEKRLATGNQDGIAKMWDARTGKELLSLTGHTASISHVAWSPDGTSLATASADGTAKVWDAASGQELLTLRGHTRSVDDVSWSPDGKHLATGSDDNTAKVWDVETGHELLLLSGGSDSTDSVAWSPDGKLLAAGNADGTARVWDAGGKELFMLAERSDTASVRSVAWSPDGKRLTTGGYGGPSRVWDASNGTEMLTLEGREFVNSISWSPDGWRIAAGTDHADVIVWDAETGKRLRTLDCHGASYVNAVAWSPDGRRLAAATTHTTTLIWEAQSGKELRILPDEGRTWVLSLAWSPDGRRLATGNDDGFAKIWDVESNQEPLRLVGHSGSYQREVGKRSGRPGRRDRGVGSVAWSPDGKRLVTSAWDSSKKTQITTVWDAQGDELFTLREGDDTARIMSATWSPDGKRLATASEDGTVQVYAMDIRELMALARQRVTAHPSEEGCRKYFHVNKCPSVPELSFW